MLKVKKKYKYALACPTSMGIRITPVDRMSVHNSNMFYMQATSAETNVLNVASSLGYKCLALTKFVKGSPIAKFIQGELRKRNIDYVGKEVEQGGPWGYRHQFNIADSGFGVKAARVWNDRAGEVGTTLDIKDFDCKQIFDRDGVGILHISGLIAALSKQSTKACVELAKYAKKSGTLISFDLNYRASFWKGREKELRTAFKTIAKLADVLAGNEEDYQLCLGLKGPKAGGNDLNSKLDSFKLMIEETKKEYKNAKVFVTTLREVISANNNLWGAIVNYENKWFIEEPRPIEIMDRIGGGDGFMGGFLYGVIKGYKADKCLSLGWAAGALAASSLNDYGEPADEKQLLDIYAGNARVQR